ncbi:MAG: tRNA (N6-isopentenyl adenosine(37)-C2)-methylthiotransferase MiaB [Ruminococcus sp.]|nr:tRNA (N6-isopentenyl adenosine(37)-C2)-methylthiotransferase MiaB [Ruminococcus sp.]
MNYEEKVKEIFGERETPPLCYIHSYGCQQNVSDGEKITGILCGLGCGVTDRREDADVIVLNTCAVRENAEVRVYGHIGELKRLKREKPEVLIIVCGCMAEEEKTAEKLKKSYPYVDVLFGTSAMRELPRLIYESLTGNGDLTVDVGERKGECFEGIEPVRTEKYKAGVSIMYGCNNFCSYCIVPYVRGRERSREPEKIIEEIKRLAESGCREIMLLGQNVNSYGRGTAVDFPELLRRINDIDGDFRVRFMSPHPKDAGRDFFDAIAQCGKVCKSVHLPLQSGSEEILKKMNRGYGPQEYLETVEYARKIMPGLSITTDIIVGFPGETEEDFQETLKIVKRVKFDNIYSFIYSKRSGTRAAEFEDNTSDREKSERMGRLLKLQRETAEENYKRFEGRVLRVLFDGEHKGLISGKSDEFIITLVKGGRELIGTVRDVRVTKVHHWAVEGDLI